MYPRGEAVSLSASRSLGGLAIDLHLTNGSDPDCAARVTFVGKDGYVLVERRRLGDTKRLLRIEQVPAGAEFVEVEFDVDTRGGVPA